MTMSLKMLNNIVVHAEGLANEAVAMAEALRAVVDDCAAQVAENKAGNETAGVSAKTTTEPGWVAEAEATVVNEPLPMATPATMEKPKAESTPVTTPKTPKAESTPTDTPATTLPVAEPGKQLTIAEVRAYVAARTRPENRAQIKAILKGFGVARLTELPEDKYAALMEEVAKL